MKKYGILVLMLVVACLAGCGGKSDSSGDAAHKDDPTHGEGAAAQDDHASDAMASAEMRAKSGSSLSGKATFVPEGGQIAFTLHVEGGAPGTHAVRIHETGDCSADDGTSAGAPWGPTAETAEDPGDLGDMEVGENGQGVLSLTTDRWSIGSGGEDDIVGKSVIVHDAAGGRIGCGVIQKEV